MGTVVKEVVLPVRPALLTYLANCPVFPFKGRLNLFFQITQSSVQWMSPTLQIASEQFANIRLVWLIHLPLLTGNKSYVGSLFLEDPWYNTMIYTICSIV